MKTKTVFFTLFVLLTATAFGQGLSINGQDTKKSNAILTTPEQQADLIFHNKPITGVVGYEKFTAEYYAKRVDVFAKIAFDKTMAQMQTINKFTNGGLLNANGKILPLTAADAEAVWRARVKRMKVNSSNKFGFVSVDNHLDGSIDTVYRQLYDNEECFVMDLRAEGFGLFVMSSALCGNPGSDNELLFALQDDPQGDPADNQESEAAHSKKSLRNNQEILTDKEQELVDNNQKDDDVKTYKTDQGTVIVFKPVIITKSGDVTGSPVTTGAVTVGSGSGDAQSGSGKRKTYLADDEESYETYSPNAVRHSQSGGSSSTRCLDCGNTNTNYVTASGRPKSSGAEIVTAVATSGHLAYDIITDIFAPGGRWNMRGRAVVGGGTTLPNTNTNTNTNTGAGEQGYGIPPQ